MNEHPEVGFDIDPELEAIVHAALRRSIVPPATPGPVRDAIEAMATNRGARAGAQWRVWRGASALASLAAVVAVLAIVGAGLALRGGGPAAATPGATLGTPGPALPDPSPGEKPATAFGWTGHGLTAWATRADGLRFTEDGGVTWSSPVALPATGDPSAEESLDFVDRLDGWQTSEILESGVWHLRVQRTDDGGATWRASEVASLADQAGIGLNVSSNLVDATHGVVLVSRPVEPQPVASSPTAATYRDCTKYVTNDGGATWTGPTPSICLFGGPKWVNRRVGEFSDGDHRAVSVTVDGGQTWRTAELPGISQDQLAWNPTLDVDSLGRLHLLVTVVPATETWSSAPVVSYVSEDDGSTWTEEFRSTTPDGLGLGNWTSALGPDHYVTVHQIGTGTPMQDDFLDSFDGGRTWSEVTTSGFSEATYMDWADELHGMLDGIKDCPSGESCDPVGTQSGGVFLTDDGGRTWHQLAFP